MFEKQKALYLKFKRLSKKISLDLIKNPLIQLIGLLACNILASVSLVDFLEVEESLDTTFTIIITLLLFIVEVELLVLRDTHYIKKRDNLRKHIEKEKSLSHVLDKIEQTNNLILRRIGHEQIRGFQKDFHFPNSRAFRGISIHNETSAIRGYREFWRQMIELQKIKLREGSPIVINAVHSNRVYIWRSEAAYSLFRLQKQFIAEGGIIRRILVDISTRGIDSKEYRDIFNEMKKAGIKVHYLRVPESTKHTRRKGDDFFITSPIDSIRYGSEWIADVNDERISEGVFFIDKDFVKSDRWNFFCELLIENYKNKHDQIPEWADGKEVESLIKEVESFKIDFPKT